MPDKKTLIASLIAVMITVGSLYWTNRTLTPKEATWNDVLAEAERGGYRIITTEDLVTQYHDNPNFFLFVDTRQEWEYRTGHIKDALNFPMEPTWWSRWRKEKQLEAFLGPDKDRPVVFY
ncbi:MAG: rhodanese-like domain-containing protein [Pseudomonadota bacterium]